MFFSSRYGASTFSRIAQLAAISNVQDSGSNTIRDYFRLEKHLDRLGIAPFPALV